MKAIRSPRFCFHLSAQCPENIVFNFPIPVNGEEVKELPLENETILETVVLMSQSR